MIFPPHISALVRNPPFKEHSSMPNVCLSDSRVWWFNTKAIVETDKLMVTSHEKRGKMLPWGRIALIPHAPEEA